MQPEVGDIHAATPGGTRFLMLAAMAALAGILIDQLAYEFLARQLTVGVAAGSLGPFPVMRMDHPRSPSELLPLLLFTPSLGVFYWGLKNELFGWLMKLAAAGSGLALGGALSNFLSLASRSFVANFLVLQLSPTQKATFVPADVLMALGFLLAVGGPVGLLLLRGLRGDPDSAPAGATVPQNQSIPINRLAGLIGSWRGVVVLAVILVFLTLGPALTSAN